MGYFTPLQTEGTAEAVVSNFDNATGGGQAQLRFIACHAGAPYLGQ